MNKDEQKNSCVWTLSLVDVSFVLFGHEIIVQRSLCHQSRAKTLRLGMMSSSRHPSQIVPETNSTKELRWRAPTL